MTKFIRLLFYHIYVYYDRSEKLGKTLTKFSTFCVFVVIFSILATTIYDLVRQHYDINYTTLPGKSYLIVCVIISIVIACYLYKEGFQDLNENYDYNKKYYYYFFIIVLLTIGLFIYGSEISRERISKQRKIQKEHIEKNNNLKNNNID